MYLVNRCTTAARRITEESVNMRVTVVRHRYYRIRSRSKGLGKVNNPVVRPRAMLTSKILRLYSPGVDWGTLLFARVLAISRNTYCTRQEAIRLGSCMNKRWIGSNAVWTSNKYIYMFCENVTYVCCSLLTQGSGTLIVVVLRTASMSVVI